MTQQLNENNHTVGDRDPDRIMGTCKTHGEIQRKNIIEITIPGQESLHCQICFAEWIKYNISGVDKP